ncbi:MAG: peptidoglycan editing factor PgeF [Bacteroidales bacterium]|nr:peptidoglycan editing factor PgeF [Bacteroidales bacterium]
MNLLEYKLGRGVSAFSTRRDACGETDGGAYSSFNITHYCGDAPEHVAECRKALCAHLGIDDEHLVLPRQTHTDHVYVLDRKYFETFPEMRWRLLEEQDAVVTCEKGVCIGVSTADCVPVLMYDAEAEVIAAVHAGWRGMVARIPQKALVEMVRLGADPKRVKVAVGPSIGPESFEVGEEVVDAFLDEGFHPCILSRQWAKPHIDLWQACSMQLEEAGVSLRNMQFAGVDTFARPDEFFSARRLGIKSGRIFTGIMMK